MNKEAIIKAIDEHIQSSGRSSYSDFYIGITNDIERRLFGEHRVNKEGMWWIYAQADTAEIARETEKHYLDLKMRGGTGGGTGDSDSKFVYCYVVTPDTLESTSKDA